MAQKLLNSNNWSIAEDHFEYIDEHDTFFMNLIGSKKEEEFGNEMKSVGHLIAHTPFVAPHSGFTHRVMDRVESEARVAQCKKSAKAVLISGLMPMVGLAIGMVILLSELRWTLHFGIDWLQGVTWLVASITDILEAIAAFAVFLPRVMMIQIWLAAMSLAWGYGMFILIRDRKRYMRKVFSNA